MADSIDVADIPLPRALQVEVTGSCNLSCRMCLVAYRPRLGRTAHLSLDALRSLLDDLPTVEELTLQGLGEPLLVTDLEQMISEASARGIRVGFNTNGTLLTRQRSEALLAAGLDWLHVSIDGANPETFAAIRPGAALSRVVDNLRTLVEVRAAAGATNPRIQLNTVVMRRNVGELEDLVRLAAGIGADRLWVQALSHDFTDVSAEPGFKEIRLWTRRERLTAEEAEPHLARVRALAEELGLAVRLPDLDRAPRRGDGEPGCDWPWRSAYVNHDGVVQSCCMLMGSERGRLGQINERPLSEIWYEPAYRALRAQLMTDVPPDPCRGCIAYRPRC